MRDDAFVRLFRRMRGDASPRPEFVEDLYRRLAVRLGEPGADPQDEAREQRPLPPAPEAAPDAPGRRGWQAAAVAAVLGLLVLGIPALFLRSAGPGYGDTTVPPVETTIPIELVPAVPIGIGVPGVVDAYYILYLPAGYDGEEPLPVIISLGTESGGHSGGLGFWGPEQADALGVAVVSVAPSGHAWAYAAEEEDAARIDDTWIGSPPPVGDADVLMIEAVLEDVEGRLPVSYLFVAGEYRGGLMAGRIACEFPDRVAAVAAYPNAFFVPAGCDAESSSVPRLSIGPEDADAQPFTAAGALAGMDDWAVRSACASRDESAADGATRIGYTDCTGGARHLIVLVGSPAPEDWDGPVPVMWSFFGDVAGGRPVTD